MDNIIRKLNYPEDRRKGAKIVRLMAKSYKLASLLMDMNWSTYYIFDNLFIPNIMPQDRFDENNKKCK